jgi:putative hemolysin
MTAIAIELAIVAVLILLNGLFAMSEIAVVSARKPRLERLARDGDAGAATALRISQSPTDFLATVQVGITLVGVVAGAYGGATFGDSPIALAIAIGLITFASLVVGELLPKRIALLYPERIAALVARPMRLLCRVTTPVVRLLSGSTELLFRLLGLHPPTEPAVSDDEIRALVAEGASAGLLAPSERAMIDNVLRLGDRTVRSIMVSRQDMEWIDAAAPAAEIERRARATDHARLPVARGEVDRIVGVVRTRDILAQCGSGIDIEKVLRKPLFVPETMPALRVLEHFRKARPHVAIVIDEYGGVQGVVTPGTIFDMIVGELADSAGRPAEPSLVKREDGSWLVDASTHLDEVQTVLDDRAFAPVEGSYESLGGLVFHRLGRIPKVAEALDVGAWRVEVVDMDGPRIDKILVQRKEA